MMTAPIKLSLLGLLIFCEVGIVSSNVSAQTPEVKVIFKVNGKTVDVPSFKASVFYPGSKKILFDLETKADGLMKMPKGLANVPKFDIEVAFLKYEWC